MNAKKHYEPAEIRIDPLDRDMLLQSVASLGEDDWASFDFSNLS